MEKKLPKNWVETTIKEINFRKSENVNPGKTPDKYFESYSVPIFETKKPEIVKGESIKSSKQVVYGDEILISKINPRINRVWKVENYTEFTKICSSEWIIVDVNDILDSDFLQYEFSAEFFRRLLQSEVSGVGGSLTRARPKIVENYKIPLPPLAEQQRIVTKLDELFGHLDSLKTRLNHIPQILKNFRQAVLTQAVTGKLTEEWRVGKELEEWKRYSIDKISETISGFAFKSKDFVEDGIQLIRMGNLYNNKLDLTRNPVFLPTNIDSKLLEKYSLKKDDILLSLTGTKYKRDYGFAIKVEENSKLLLNQRILALRPTIEIDFFLYLLRENDFRNQFFATETGGVNQGNVGTTAVKAIKVNVPPKEEQIEIVKRVEHLFAKADTIEAQYQSLKTKIDSLPQAILAKAFKGELVEQLDTDGSAEVLLEEIKKLKAEEKKKPRKKSTKKSNIKISKKKIIKPNPEFPLYSVLLNYSKGLSEKELYKLSGLSQHLFLTQFDKELESGMIKYDVENKMLVKVVSK